MPMLSLDLAALWVAGMTSIRSISCAADHCEDFVGCSHSSIANDFARGGNTVMVKSQKDSCRWRWTRRFGSFNVLLHTTHST